MSRGKTQKVEPGYEGLLSSLARHMKKNLQISFIGDAERNMIDQVLLTLHEREAEVLILRFALHGGKPKTCGKIAAEFRLTREKGSQLFFGAVHKLTRRKRYKVWRLVTVQGLREGLAEAKGTFEQIQREIHTLSKSLPSDERERFVANLLTSLSMILGSRTPAPR